jgi:hypothetical protein
MGTYGAAVIHAYALKSGYGRTGARIGSRDGESEFFKAEMLAFWKRLFGKLSQR